MVVKDKGPRSCGSGNHEWVPNWADDPLYRRIMPSFLGPWYQCRKCHFATSPQLQPPGWKP